MLQKSNYSIKFRDFSYIYITYLESINLKYVTKKKQKFQTRTDILKLKAYFPKRKWTLL